MVDKVVEVAASLIGGRWVVVVLVVAVVAWVAVVAVAVVAVAGVRGDLPGGWVRGRDLGGREGYGYLRGKRGWGLQGVPRSRERPTWVWPSWQLNFS